MIASAVTVFPWGKSPADNETFHQTNLQFFDLATDIIHRSIHSNRSTIADHTLMQHIFQLLRPFFKLLQKPFCFSATRAPSVCCWIISLTVNIFLQPMYFYHFIHHLFSWSITLLHTHLLSSSHTYMHKPFVTSLVRFDKAVCASGTGGNDGCRDD